MDKSDLRKDAKIAHNAMTKLNTHEIVSLGILTRICDVFDCDFGDIMELIKGNQDENI